MVDLRQIVIVRRQPKYRHKTPETAPVEVVRELDRGQRFIDRVEGPGKKPDLLPGDHRAGPVADDLPDRAQCLGPAAVTPVLFGQDRGQVFPRDGTRPDSLGLALKGGEVPKVAVVKLADLAVIIEIVIDQGRKVRGPCRSRHLPEGLGEKIEEEDLKRQIHQDGGVQTAPRREERRPLPPVLIFFRRVVFQWFSPPR